MSIGGSLRRKMINLSIASIGSLSLFADSFLANVAGDIGGAGFARKTAKGDRLREEAVKKEQGNAELRGMLFDLLRGEADTFLNHLTVGGNTHKSSPSRDFLVLTRLPNIFSDNYDLGSHGLFVASGMHGAGTKALDIVLSDRRAMQQVLKLVNDFRDAWQVVLIVHVDPVSGEPAWVETPEVAKPLDADFDRLHLMMGEKLFWISPDDPSQTTKRSSSAGCKRNRLPGLASARCAAMESTRMPWVIRASGD